MTTAPQQARCGRCAACTALRVSLREILSRPNPPFGETGEIVQDWTKAVEEHACVAVAGN